MEFYIHSSSIFDNPDNKYDLDLFSDVLQNAGAHCTISRLNGWRNQPEIVCFTNLSKERAYEVLEELPVFSKWSPMIIEKDWK